MQKRSAAMKAFFLNKEDLTIEQLEDPDFRLKQLQKLSGNKDTFTCSKCHHCR
jgi:hypothetical protein